MNKVREALNNIPWHMASKAEWRRRGFRLRFRQYPVQYLKIWNGMYFNRIKVYDSEQVEPIRGVKASLRREMWLSQLDNIIG